MARVRTRFRRGRRARLAVIACLLWLVGVEALPAAHEALHDHFALHTHVAGSIVVSSFEDTTHRHPDGTIHFVAAKPRRARHGADGRAHVSEPGHTADGLAHHAAAIAPAAPPVHQPLPVDRRPIVLAIVERVEPVRLDPLAAVARGPPASSRFPV